MFLGHGHFQRPEPILPEALSLSFLTGGSKRCHTPPMTVSVPCPGSVLTVGLAHHSWERGIMAVLRGTLLPPYYEQAKIRGSTVGHKPRVHGTALNSSIPIAQVERTLGPERQ